MQFKLVPGGCIVAALLFVAGCQVNTAVDNGAGDGGASDAGVDAALLEDASAEDVHGSDTGAHDGGSLDGGGLKCSNSAQCESGYVCIKGVCQASSDGGSEGTCATVLDCSQGYECIGGKCTPIVMDGGPQDAGPLDGGNTCGLGFCREMINQGCGDPNYVPEISRTCTTSNGKAGYCCEPAAQDSCAPYGGYCAFGAPCKIGYASSQVHCGGGGPAGYCCIPESIDGGGPLDGGPAPCNVGDTKKYTCQDFTQVPWCTCTNGAWNCSNDPASQCKIPCLDNCNCPQDRPICNGGTCLPRNSTSCTGDAKLCACGETCVNGSCTPSQMLCKSPCDCPIMDVANFTCVNGACVPKTDNNCNLSPCLCYEVCANVGPTTTCKTGCSNNCDCPGGMICHVGSTGDGLCLNVGNVNCDLHPETCPCGQVCINSTCHDAPLKCRENCDCHDPANPICHNGVCGQAQGTLDCPCGLVCGL